MRKEEEGNQPPKSKVENNEGKRMSTIQSLKMKMTKD